MRGTIVERRRRCGRENCACARDEEARHPSKFLSVHLEGRTVAIHLRPEDEERVRRAIEAYARVWEIINGLTACEVADLRREAGDRSRARRRRRE
jgi:RNA:NAD 2'-phosphotransferase (TPT1/KptA family)